MAKQSKAELRIPDPKTKSNTSDNWGETFNRFPDDLLIRKHKYEIASRPVNGEPTWKYKKTGYIFPQRIVLQSIAILEQRS